LLVEVPGSWGSDVVADTDIAKHVSDDWRATLRQRGVRPLGIRRDLRRDRGDAPLQIFFVEAAHGPRRPGSVHRCEVAGLFEVTAVTAALPCDEMPNDRWEPVDEALAL